MVSIASLLGAWHLWEVVENKPASSHVVSLGKALNGTPHLHVADRFFVLFYLPYLSSIHEKANCIAILWTGSPHSLGSCLFRGLWVTCLPHKDGASR